MLTRKVPMKRKPIRQVSNKQRAFNVELRKIKREFQMYVASVEEDVKVVI